MKSFAALIALLFIVALVAAQHFYAQEDYFYESSVEENQFFGEEASGNTLGQVTDTYLKTLNSLEASNIDGLRTITYKAFSTCPIGYGTVSTPIYYVDKYVRVGRGYDVPASFGNMNFCTKFEPLGDGGQFIVDIVSSNSCPSSYQRVVNTNLCILRGSPSEAIIKRNFNIAVVDNEFKPQCPRGDIAIPFILTDLRIKEQGTISRTMICYRKSVQATSRVVISKRP